MRSLSQSLVLFTAEHGGAFPDSLAELNPRGPTSGNDYYDDFGSGLIYDKAKAQLDGRADPVLVMETANQHSVPGAWVCYKDGRLAWLQPDEYKRISSK